MKVEQNKELSIIIVSYNVSGLLQNCISSIKKNAENLDYEIIIIDNDSNDNTCQMIKQYPDIIFIQNQENIGFGKACNQGLKIAKGEYILFLNPDTEIIDNALQKLIEKLNQDKKIGFIGPKIINKDGSFQAACRRTIPNIESAFFKSFGLAKLFPKHPVISKYNLGNIPIDQEMEVKAISGSCMLIPKSILDKTDGFDEDFFMYGEDLDLCLRITNTGYKGCYLPTASILHCHRGSSNKRKFKSIFHFYYSAFLFYKKHYGCNPFIIVVALMLMIRAGIACLNSLLKKN